MKKRTMSYISELSDLVSFGDGFNISKTDLIFNYKSIKKMDCLINSLAVKCDKENKDKILKLWKERRKIFKNLTKQFIVDNQFSNIEGAKCGMRVVEKEGMFNFLDDCDNIISDIWFDYVEEFKNNVAVVTKTNIDYAINRNGDLMQLY